MARILLVDDYRDALDAWRLYLQMAGFEVVTASDGQEALALVAGVTPDLAILDLELPGLSGFDLARRLRADPATRHLPLIAVTGHSDPDVAEQARRSGVDRVLTKPCDPDLLCLAITRLLALRAGVVTAPDTQA